MFVIADTIKYLWKLVSDTNMNYKQLFKCCVVEYTSS